MDEKLSHGLVKELTRVVDKLSDVFSDNQKRYEAAAETNAKHFESLSREGQRHYENLKSADQKRYEALTSEVRHEHEKEVRRQRLDAYIIATVSVFSICLSVIVASYWSLEERKIGLKRVQLLQNFNAHNAIQSRITYLQQEINERFALRNQLMEAMVKVRGVRDIGQKQCENGQYAGSDPVRYQQQLFADSYNLVGASYKTIGIFGNAIKNELVKFGTLSGVDQEGICAKNAATEKELRPLQARIDQMILAEITELEKQKQIASTELNKEMGKEDKFAETL